MAVPTALDPSSGDKLTAATFDAGVRDPINYYLAAHPRVHAYNSAALTFTDTAVRVLNFDAEVYDTDSMHSTASNTSRITATTAGLYEFHWFVRMASTTYTLLDLDIRLNANAGSGGGSSIFPANMPFASGSTFRLINFHYTQFMNAGDYHEAFITQTSGANRVNTAGAFMTFCQARWVASS